LPPLEARQTNPFQGLNQSRPLWGRIFTIAFLSRKQNDAGCWFLDTGF